MIGCAPGPTRTAINMLPLVLAAVTAVVGVRFVFKPKKSEPEKPVSYGMRLRFPKKPEPISLSNRFSALMDLADAEF